MQIFTKKFLNLLRKNQLACSLEITVEEIKVTKAKHFTDKSVVLLLRLLTPDGEVIKIIPEPYHHTDTWELNVGDTATVHGLGTRIEISDL